MAGLQNLSQMIQAYDAATGQHLNQNQPWQTPGGGNWDTGGPNSPHAAFNAWITQQLGYTPDFGTANVSGSSQPLNKNQSPTSGSGAYGGNAAAQANPVNPYQPSTIQSQFPGGIPQLTAAQIMGAPQVQAQNIGGLPQANAQQISSSGMPQANAGQLNNPFQVHNQNVNAQQLGQPGSIIGHMGGANAYSADTATKAISDYLKPQFQQQQQGMTEALANAGIVGGSSMKAQSDLGSQQQTTMMNDIQPYLMQLKQMQQTGTTQDIANQIMTGQSNQSANLQGQMANQGANLSAQQSNQSAQLQRDIQQHANQLQAQGMNMQQAMQIATQNAANSLQAQGMNMQQAYQVASFNAQQSMQAQTQNQNTWMTGAQYNANSLTGAQQYNIGNQLATAGTDATSYNNMLQQIMGLQHSAWSQQLGAAGSTATAGLGASTGAFQPIYQQPGQANYSGIGQAFARPASANNSPPPQSSYGPNYGGPNPTSAFGYNYNPF